MTIKVPIIDVSGYTKHFACLRYERGCKNGKLLFFCKRQTLLFVAARAGPCKAGTIWTSQDPMRYFEIVGKGEVGDLKKSSRRGVTEALQPLTMTKTEYFHSGTLIRHENLISVTLF